MEEHEGDEDQAAGGGGFNPELLRSYLSFAKRSIHKHRFAAIGLFLLGAGLTIALVKYLPRTYESRTVLMAQATAVLDRNDASNALSGADGLIKRRENLEALIRDTGLVRNAELRRPPLLKLKDRIVTSLFGEMDEKTQIAVLVGTLENKINCSTENNQLTISVAWGDGQTAADLAQAARESFLRTRHSAEISAFEDKMAILDEHASKLRQDVALLASQMQTESTGGATETPAPTTTPAPARATVARGSSPRRPDAMVTEQLTALKEKLTTAKAKLADLEGDWQRRLHEAKVKLDDMSLRLTPNHPEVVTQQQRVANLSQVPSEVASLRAEVSTLQGDIKAGDLLVAHGGGSGGTVAGGSTESLPAEVLQALSKDNADPALRAQLSGAIIKYGDLRNEILNGKIELDTAQAAFNHRYQISVPAEVPDKASKPKPGVIVGGGFFISLLLALLVPILLELRKGVMVETWQVHELQLPVLAELRLPPRSD